MENKKVYLEMIRDLQCPGCISGPSCNPENGMHQECPSFSFNFSQNRCDGHILGTHFGLGNLVALGMPIGFNKAGQKTPESVNERKNGTSSSSFIDVLFFASPEKMDYVFNHLNIPVWYLKEKDYFFIRVFSPRINRGQVLVIKDGDKSLIPKHFKAFDVAEFQDEID